MDHKRSLFFVALLFIFITTVHAQNIAINDNGAAPDTTAMLDISSNTKGFLIPRMTAAQRNAITSPAQGLLVYSITDSSFYYYSNGWNRLSKSNEAWGLNGNAGTNPATNFIGTTDGTPLRFKVANDNAGLLNTSQNNSAFGRFSLDSVTGAGVQNTAIGANSLRNNTDGYVNTALGSAAGFGNKDGAGNTFIGAYADALYPTLLASSAIGYNAKVAQSNSLVLGQPVTRVGIGISRPVSQLSNIDSNIVGSSTYGINSQSIAWKTQQQGFVAALYNKDTVSGANGLAVKIANNTASGILFDLSTGPSITAPGQSVMLAGGNGNVGINNISPQQKLDVAGKATIRDSLGIGKVNPQQTLDVAGKAIIRDSLGIGVTNPTAQLQLGNTTQNRKIVLYNDANNGHNFYGFGISASTLRYQVSSVLNDHVFFAGTSSTSSNELIRIKGNGNVGINNNNPQQKLDVAGKATIRDSLGIGISSPNAQLQLGNLVQNRKLVLWDNTGNDNEFYGLGINNNVLRYQTPGASSDHVFYAGSSSGTSTELLRIKGDGSIGIKISNPASLLSNTNLNIAASDNIGINTNSFSWTMNDVGYTQALYNSSAGAGSNGLSVKIASTNSFSSILDLSTGAVQNGAGTSVFVVKGDGNVGIGASAINEKLVVNGAVKIANGGYTSLINNATTPVPSGGAGTMAFSNGHFFGWNGTSWKQLDN